MKDNKFNIFEKVQVKGPGFSRVDMSHSHRTSFRMGWLVPTLCKELIPKDKFTIRVESMIRLAAMLAPVMHRVHITHHFFVVPDRIIWPNFEKFITGHEDDPVYPTLLYHNTNYNTISNYMGLPFVTIGNATEISAIPIAAYHKIYNEYYRDQNLIDEDTYQDSVVDGDNPALATAINGIPILRAWTRDYFTSALPWPQKGDAATIPLGTFQDVPIYLDIQGTPNAGMLIRDSTGSFLASSGGMTHLGSAGTPPGLMYSNQSGNPPIYLDPNANLYADTSTMEAQAADITSLRRAFRLQEFMEREARGGTRYNEVLKTAFDVNSSDKRIQRPEYIGGWKGVVTMSEVLSTAETLDSSDNVVNPVGSLQGHGIGVGGSKGISYYNEEWSWLFCITNVQPLPSYFQGLHRQWTRTDRFDWFWKEFQNIGEQAILNKEVYADQLNVDQEAVFGYIPRYSEYKFENNRSSGEFQNTLDFWTMDRKFTTAPTLSQTFIECDATTRIFAVPSADDHVYAHFYFDWKLTRPMQMYSDPRL